MTVHGKENELIAVACKKDCTNPFISKHHHVDTIWYLKLKKLGEPSFIKLQKSRLLLAKWRENRMIQALQRRILQSLIKLAAHKQKLQIYQKAIYTVWKWYPTNCASEHKGIFSTKRLAITTLPTWTKILAGTAQYWCLLVRHLQKNLVRVFNLNFVTRKWSYQKFKMWGSVEYY